MSSPVNSNKVGIEQAKFASGAKPEDVIEWSMGVEEQAGAVEEITYLSKRLTQVNLKTNLETKKCEEQLVEKAPDKQLQFEHAQLELKLDYERNMEEERKGQVGQVAASSPVKSAKLPQLYIIQFSGELTDWPRFWNQFEAEVDHSTVAGVTKFSYLKELMEPKVRTAINEMSVMQTAEGQSNPFEKESDKTPEKDVQQPGAMGGNIQGDPASKTAPYGECL